MILGIIYRPHISSIKLAANYALILLAGKQWTGLPPHPGSEV